MLAPGFNRWGQVFLHFGTSPPSRIQPKPLAAKMQPGPAADPKPQAWCEAEGWAELNQCGTSPAFGQPLLGRPYRRLACPDFACRSAVSGERPGKP
jgi:hypothetical protein